MKIENVYKCLRCGKLMSKIDINATYIATDSDGDFIQYMYCGERITVTEHDPLTHHCDPTNNKQIGILQKVGFNIIEN